MQIARKILPLLFLMLAWVMPPTAAHAQASPPGPAALLAPSGKLRVLAFENGVLYARNPAGEVDGLAHALGAFMAAKLGVPFEPLVQANPEAYASAVAAGGWDIAIGPRSPALASRIDMGADIALVDNLFIAAPGRQFADVASVDAAGVRIGTAQNSPPDQLLSRTLKNAQLVRVAGGIPISVDLMRSGGADVFASNGEVVHAIAAAIPGSRIVGPFTTVRMAAGLPAGANAAARDALAELLRQSSTEGIVRASIEKLSMKGVRLPQ